MAGSEQSLISAARRLLGNPYAHMEQLEESQRGLDAHHRAAMQAVSSIRKVLENPYAHADRLGMSDMPATGAPATTLKNVVPSKKALGNPYAGIEALDEADTAPRSGRPMPIDAKSYGNPYRFVDGQQETRAANAATRTASVRRWKDSEIELKARDLQFRLWRDRVQIWDGKVPADPVELLDASVALDLVGFDFEYVDGLGHMSARGGPIEVAGLIDTAKRVVRVGRHLPTPVRSFTTAHELGHAVLHPSLGTMHRDRPLDGSPQPYDPIEAEANKFATYFLMPANLVRARFEEAFRMSPFVLSDESAFALRGKSLGEVINEVNTQRSLARLLAGVDRFDGRSFVPLHVQFRVSRIAMAIRIEELGLLSA
ncbi:ImmA/IrrE family metallo-endopeptidase [Ideonella sp. DXS22W]|uniref:ImmA/IrrE family metallo-endopeptidase n=1 Tax=Pseudaquabacterium inlustre TaxID=2984192 RepID=A0ABU9CCR8_9BURK